MFKLLYKYREYMFDPVKTNEVLTLLSTPEVFGVHIWNSGFVKTGTDRKPCCAYKELVTQHCPGVARLMERE